MSFDEDQVVHPPSAVEVRYELLEHIAVCDERWPTVRRELTDIKASIRGVWWLILVCAGTLIVGMAGLIVTLALTGHH